MPRTACLKPNGFPPYVMGVIWFITSLLISNLNDAASKYLGANIPAIEVAFFRFLFGTLSLLPFMLVYGAKTFVTSRPLLHISRGALLFLAMYFWTLGMQSVPITTVTIMSFTVPIFVLIMAPITLGERVSKQLWIATMLCMFGVFIVLDPSNVRFKPMSLVFLISAMMFALLDIINKKYVIKETMLSMLFYSALVTTILASYPAHLVWQQPTTHELLILFLLGAGGNLILYCLLKAFMYIEASALTPYRYLELLVSAFVGWLLFNEVPDINMYLGASIIIPTTLFVAYKQGRKED